MPAQLRLVSNLLDRTTGYRKLRPVRCEKLGDLRIAECRALIGMVHDKRTLPAELVPDGIGRTDGATCVACRRLHIHSPERRHPPYLPIGDGVHCTTAGQREVGQPAA